jgi:glycine dehydrogenase
MCDAFIAIREEIREIEKGKAEEENNVLTNAPHPQSIMTADEWPYPYTRGQAAYPVEGLKDRKFWPTVGKLDDVYGDRNVICTCPSVEEWVR